MADPEAARAHPSNTGANLPAGFHGYTSMYLPNSGPEDLLRGPLLLVLFSRVLSIPFYLLCALWATDQSRWWIPVLPAERLSWLHIDRLLLAGGLWVLALMSVLLAWLFFTRRRAFRPLMSLFCCLHLLLMAGIYLHYQHFASVYGYTVSLGFGSSWLENVLVVFSYSSFVWPFYYAFSPRAKRVFTR